MEHKDQREHYTQTLSYQPFAEKVFEEASLEEYETILNRLKFRLDGLDYAGTLGSSIEEEVSRNTEAIYRGIEEDRRNKLEAELEVSSSEILSDEEQTEVVEHITRGLNDRFEIYAGNRSYCPLNIDGSSNWFSAEAEYQEAEDKIIIL